MWKTLLQSFWYSFTDIFNMKNGDARGRSLNLMSGILCSLYNVFITGIFYTGFLTMYGIDITGMGIVSFIPSIASMFSIFSSKVLSRFKNKKAIILACRIYFHFMYIVAINLMPLIVKDPQGRLIWFCIILFLAYAVNAIFAPGLTVWMYQLYPKESHRRSRYFMYTSICSSVVSSVIMFLSGLLTDAVAGSPFQQTLIIGLRYFSFVLVLVELLILIKIEAKPIEMSGDLKIRDIFIKPFKYRKFMYCMVFMFIWNYVGNLNSGVWSYHLLNHMNFSYTLLNTMSVVNTVILTLISGLWNKVLRRLSWMRTFAVGCLIFVPTEFLFFMMSKQSGWIYVPNSIIQTIASVGLNLAYGNVLYMNLPKEDSTTHIAFNTIGCNLFAFLGLVTGTAISSISGDTMMNFMGMQLYSIQFTTLMRGVALFAIGVVLMKYWRVFTNDEEVEAVERDEAARRNMAKIRGPIDLGYVLRYARGKMRAMFRKG